MKRAKRPNTAHQEKPPVLALRAWMLGAILVVLVAFVYGPTLSNGFIWDDDQYVEENPTLQSLHGLHDIWFKLGAVPQYYPLVHTSFWIETHLWGLHPLGFHAVNLILHAISTLLVWRLLTQLAVPGAWLAAAIFGVHPVEVESVAWITERKNVLSCALALGALLAWFRFDHPDLHREDPATQGNWRFYLLAIALYVAALLSKTVTVTLPAVILVIDWWKRGRLTWRDGGRLAPFFAQQLACRWLPSPYGWKKRTLGPMGTIGISPTSTGF